MKGTDHPEDNIKMDLAEIVFGSMEHIPLTQDMIMTLFTNVF